MGTKLVRCSWRRCEREMSIHDAHVYLAGPLGHNHVRFLCPFHFVIIDQANRIRFWRRHRLPKIETMRVDDDLQVYATYNPRDNTIRVTQQFAALDVVKQVYVLLHEEIHHVISRDVGGLSSVSLDILYMRSLRCLGGRSLHEWMLNGLYETQKL